MSDRLSSTIAKGDHRCSDIPITGNVNQKIYNPLILPQTEKHMIIYTNPSKQVNNKMVSESD